jgi:hypothetical protein
MRQMSENQFIPELNSNYRDIIAVKTSCFASDISTALSEGAILLNTCPNPDKEEIDEPFCFAVGLPDSVTKTPWLQAYFGVR